MAYEDPRNESMTNVFRQVIDDVRELFREELALARAELRQEAWVFTHSAINLGVAAVVGLYAGGFVLLGIAQLAARWWGIGTGPTYILMGIVLGFLSGVALLMARARMAKLNVVPPKTAETLEETKEWAQHRMSSSTR